ncbi:MAG: TIGR00266 family protein [Synergistaceae bacterium]|nr:TIGR00266 family protein [Synergistaceae bacterium]
MPQLRRERMRYEILHQDAFPVVRCDLSRGESLKAESDAMVAMSANLDVSGSMGDGGFLGGLARKFLTGESFFFQRITASRGPGSVLLGHSAPGGIVDVVLDGTYGLRVQKDGFLASEESVEMDTAMQNLSQGFFSGEGLFVLNVRGKGIVFLSSFGAIHPIELADGEEVIIDNGHLVAWPDYMNYKIEKASSGWFSSVTSGESLVCRFRGPGTVLIQTRNPDSFSAWLKGMIGPR